MELTPSAPPTITYNSPSKNIEDLIEEELNLTPQEAVLQHSEKKE